MRASKNDGTAINAQNKYGPGAAGATITTTARLGPPAGREDGDAHEVEQSGDDDDAVFAVPFLLSLPLGFFRVVVVSFSLIAGVILSEFCYDIVWWWY